ncbi:MAG: L-fucose:H+ symporter permease [Pseudoflavonifractor sp.]|nr:L-fucose:H+ symporter permease [Alloprevotella sp.]MCM1116870.1 L-fucose:H+ symporter permease [Pseudoflavonifractor sp.]
MKPNEKPSGRYLLPFILITACFALWGFANDITNPMVKAFSKIFRMSVADGAMVQLAFYGGYFCMAFPAALFIRRYSYRAGVMLGLGLYGFGAFLFYPAMLSGMYLPFLIAYFVLTCGLSFLETSCNPYVYAMGPEATATRRLNLAQCFNPIGSLLGMYVAMNFIQNRLDSMDTAQRAILPPEAFEAVKEADLLVLVKPYLAIGAVVVAMMALISLVKMPGTGERPRGEGRVGESLRRLWHRARYRRGVIAQFFYVGAQIMCWTFIIQYGTHIFMDQGIGEKEAEVMSQEYNICAMVIMCLSRFICTYMLKYISPGRLLTVMATMAVALVSGVVMLRGIAGLYCLVAVSACMSLMFPTIYGMALEGSGDDAEFGSAGLIMAILGGSVLPPLQAAIIDCGSVMGYPAVNVSFLLPLICFVVVASYGMAYGKPARIKSGGRG